MEEITVDKLLEVGASQAEFRLLSMEGTGAPAFVVPAGYDVHIPSTDSVKAWMARPSRKTGRFTFETVESFVRYFNEHKTPDSRIFAAGFVFRGVLNFHGEKPDFGDHTAVLELKETPEFIGWSLNAGVEFTQDAFAQFLEDNKDWFQFPSGLDLLELVTNLEGTKSASFNSAIRLQNGQVKFGYDEDIEVRKSGGTGAITVPGEIMVSITPFEGMVPMQMAARLRFRLRDRRLVFYYLTVAPHEVKRAVIADVLAQIEKGTGVAPFRSI